MAGVRVQHVTTLDEMDSLKDIWKTFEDLDDGSSSLYQSWDWCRDWCTYMLEPEANLGLEVRVIEESNGRPLAIIPLFSRNLLGSALRIIEFIGYRTSPHNDVLSSRPHDPDLADDITNALWRSLDRRSIFHLRNLSGESKFTQILTVQNLAQLQCDRLWLEVDPEVSDPMQRLSKTRRKRLRNARNSLNKQGEVSYRVVPVDELSSAFNELVVLHTKRFQSKNWNTLLCGRNLDFLRSVITRLGKKNISEILQLRLNENTIASQLSFVHNEQYHVYQFSFNVEYAKYSPVWILEIESIRRSFDELHCKRHNFGQGYGDYKYSWYPKIGSNYFSTYGKGSLHTQVFAFIYRSAFKRYATQTKK
jgi:CelD/BcsL family acetyltransferase involved in cellulose biosynthesis